MWEGATLTISWLGDYIISGHEAFGLCSDSDTTMGDSGSIGIQRHAFHVFIHCCISVRHQLSRLIHTYPRPYTVVIRPWI